MHENELHSSLDFHSPTVSHSWPSLDSMSSQKVRPTLSSSFNPSNEQNDRWTLVPSSSPAQVSYDMSIATFGSNVCPKSIDGLFGDVSSVKSTLEFSYKVETNQTNATAVSREVLPDLERTIVEDLLSIVFDQCGSSRKHQKPLSARETLDWQVDRHATNPNETNPLNPPSLSSIKVPPPDDAITGVSPRPADVVKEVHQCFSNVCLFSIEGRMALYSDSNVSIALRNTIIAAIREGMENGEYLQANLDLKNVTYVYDSLPQPSLTIKAAAKRDHIGAVSCGILAGAAVLMLIGALVRKRYLRKLTTKRRQMPEESNSSIHGMGASEACSNMETCPNASDMPLPLGKAEMYNPNNSGDTPFECHTSKSAQGGSNCHCSFDFETSVDSIFSSEDDTQSQTTEIMSRNLTSLYLAQDV